MPTGSVAAPLFGAFGANIRGSSIRMQTPGVRSIGLVLLDEGIRVIGVHGCKGVVHITMIALIGKHALQAIDPHRIISQLPVGFCQGWRRKFRPLLVQGRTRRFKLALNIFMQTRRCIRSFSASSSKVWIQP